MKYLIIGAGIAGVTAAKTIIKREPSAEVILLGGENSFPYKRYLLTDYLCGLVSEEEIYYGNSDDFLKSGIRFRRGEVVSEVNITGQHVRLFHGEVLSYDKLLIAVGGKPVPGSLMKKFSQHIQQYHTIKDVKLLRQRLPEIDSCVITGEGLSALDFLRGMWSLNKKIYLITHREKIWFPLIDKVLKHEIHEFLEKKGIEIITEDKITDITKTDFDYKVKTLNEREINVDMVFASVNHHPDVSFLKDSGIDFKTGILTNTDLSTSADSVFAAGDCAEIFHPVLKDYWINFGWPNALKQGEIAGINMTGGNEEYEIKERLIINLMGKPIEARWWS